MSERKLDRAEALSRVQRGEVRLSQAADLPAVSYREAKRLWQRYRAGEPTALRHGNAGRTSNRAKPAVKHGLRVNHETLRRWMR